LTNTLSKEQERRLAQIAICAVAVRFKMSGLAPTVSLNSEFDQLMRRAFISGAISSRKLNEIYESAEKYIATERQMHGDYTALKAYVNAHNTFVDKFSELCKRDAGKARIIKYPERLTAQRTSNDKREFLARL